MPKSAKSKGIFHIDITRNVNYPKKIEKIKRETRNVRLNKSATSKALNQSLNRF